MEVIRARGHPNVKATHKTTFEITKDEDITPRGDCIIGVRADKSVRDLSDDLKDWLRSGRPVKIEILLPDYDLRDEIVAYGDANLTFKDGKDIVVRKSNYICDRTLAIRSNKSARDIKREIVERLKEGCELIVKIYKVRSP